VLQIFYELTPDTMVEMQTVRYRSFVVGATCSAGDAFVGNLPFDDPGGTLEVKGWRKFQVHETTATPTLLASGRIHDKTVKRGDSDRGSLRTGADRWWDCGAYDNNTLLGSRLLRGTSANRPQETAGERLAWLLSTSFTVLHDEGHVTYPSDVLDPADYTLQTAADLIADCAQPGGYNFFAFQTDTLDATDTPELFFMLPTDSDWASSISISDDLSDVDGVTVFAPNYGAELAITDDLIAEGVAVPYAGTGDNPYVYVDDSAIGDEFAYVNRTAPMANVKTSAKATVIANRHLDLSSTEDEKITCTIHVPASLANAVRPWHRIAYKSTWMPNFQSYRDCRVVRWGIEQQPHPDGGEGYLVHLELSPVEEYVPPASCSTSLANATATTFDVPEVGTSGSMSLAVSPSYAGPTVLIPAFAANSGNPNATIGAFTGGFSSVYAVSGTGAVAFRVGFQQATAPTTATAGASWSGVIGDGGTLGVHAAIPSSSSAPVQDASATGGAASFATEPAAGNIVVAVCHAYDVGVISMPGPNGPQTGWVLLGSVSNNATLPVPPYNGNNRAAVAIYARCAEAGDGTLYNFTKTGGPSGNTLLYIAELEP
jgi:hypothetical protein